MRRTARDPVWWIGALVAGLALAWVALRPAGVFWSLDEGGKFIYLQNVLRTGDPRAPLEYPGRNVDPDLQAVPLFYFVRDGGAIYSWWAPGFPLLTLPLYGALGWMGLFVVPALAGGACAGLAGGLVRQLLPQPGWLAPAAALLVGVATPVAYYSTTYWEHTLSAACFVGAVGAILQAERAHAGLAHANSTESAGRPIHRQEWLWLSLAGALGALATWLRTDVVALMAGLLGVLVLWRWWHGLVAAIAYVIGSVPWLVFNTWVMGHPLSRYWGALTEGAVGANAREAGLTFVAYALFNAPAVLAYELPTRWLLAGLLAVALALAAALPGRGRWLALPGWLALAGISGYVLAQGYGYRSVHGFVLIAPHVVFAAWLRPGRARTLPNLFAWAILAATAAYGAIYLARGWVAAGGLQWGPRYMLALYPLLAVASLVGLARAWPSLGRWLRGAAVGLYVAALALGLGYQARGLRAQRQTVLAYAQAHGSLMAVEVDALVTPCTWMPMVLPDLYWSGRVFNAADVDAWAGLARQAGLRSAAVVEMDACRHIPLDQVEILAAANPAGITVEPFSLAP